MLLLHNREETFGILSMHGHIDFFRVVQTRNNVNISDITIRIIDFFSLGCFAFFCSCCFEYKLFKRAGEHVCACMCPGSRFALRSKIRTAFRIEVLFVIIGLENKNYKISQ